MIIKFTRWFNKKTRYLHWYSVELSYSARIGGRNSRSKSLDQSLLRKIFGHWVEKLSHDRVKNGYFSVRLICYLGYFKQDRKKREKQCK